MDAWRAYTDNTLANNRSQGRTFGIGVMGAADMAFAQAKGAAIASGMIHVEDSLMVAPKSAALATARNALTREEWHALPAGLATPESVLWDTENNALLYVLPSLAGPTAKIALRLSKMGGGKTPIDNAATVYKVSAASLDVGLKSGTYQQVRQ